MSQVSRRHPSFLDPAVKHLIERIKASAQHGIVPSFLGNDLGEAGSPESVVCANAKQSGAPAQPRHPVTVNPLEDQLHVIRPADVEVLADHLLEEHAVGVWSVEDLSQGELSLKDQNVVTIAGCSILEREGVGDAR